MEMISEQAIRKGFRDRLNIFGVQIHEVSVVALLNKNILAVVTAIIDMIVSIVKQRWRTCHIDCLCYETLKVFLPDSRLDLHDSPARNGAGSRGKPLGSFSARVDSVKELISFALCLLFPWMLLFYQ